MSARPARGAARRDEGGARKPRAALAAAPWPAVPPALLTLVALVAALLVALAVTTPIDDPDVWQHLAVGRAIATLRALPHTNVWTWPGYGQPYFVPSWLFRVLLWPFWQAGGLVGLYGWRWLTTLAAFALLWRASRRAGATGVAPFVVLAWCALFWRQRSQLRPDTLVAVLLALELWLLEARRSGAKVSAWWLVPVAWVWVNAHISYLFFFAIAIAYLADAVWRTKRGAPTGESPRALALALAVALAACFANPYGLETLRQPFEYFLVWRHEPIYRGIWELQPLEWRFNVRNGLAPFLALTAVFALLRARREGLDVAQLVLLPLAAQMFATQRFVGYFALVAAPFVARDLAHALARVPRPAWLAAPATRAALACVACVAVTAPELTRPEWPVRIGLVDVAYPKAACDWIEAHDVHGRAFNTFSQGGYLLWRFWPQRDRLPFIDVHQTGTREDRDRYAYAWADPESWRELDRERRFDWALLVRKEGSAQHLEDVLDADPEWALVFADDAASLYLRRDGSMAALAEREAFRWVPAGNAALPAMAALVVRDTVARAGAKAELARQIAASPLVGQAHSQLANLEALDEDWAAALAHLDAARRIDPALPRLAEREADARRRLAAGSARP